MRLGPSTTSRRWRQSTEASSPSRACATAICKHFCIPARRHRISENGDVPPPSTENSGSSEHTACYKVPRTHRYPVTAAARKAISALLTEREATSAQFG